MIRENETFLSVNRDPLFFTLVNRAVPCRAVSAFVDY